MLSPFVQKHKDCPKFQDPTSLEEFNANFGAVYTAYKARNFGKYVFYFIACKVLLLNLLFFFFPAVEIEYAVAYVGPSFVRAVSCGRQYFREMIVTAKDGRPQGNYLNIIVFQE